MAKGFPYFKFIATEWMTGDIVFEDFELQGIFINVCALYWHRDGVLTLDEVQKRLKTARLNSLTDRFFSVSNGFISIKFLDEQLIDAGHISKVNSVNGSKGGRPKAASTLENKPTANRPLTERKAKKSKEEEKESKEEVELEEKENYQTPELFLKERIDLDSIAMKSGMNQKDFDFCLTQWSLKCEEAGFEYTDDSQKDLKKLRAGFEKWLNTWVKNNSKPKPISTSNNFGKEPPKYKLLT